MSQPDYAAVAVVHPMTSQWELMSEGGRVIVFDTAAVAWEWLPLLGQGRQYSADASRREIVFWEVSRLLPNRARVISPYQPGEKMPWKRHQIWSSWWTDCGQLRESEEEHGGDRVHV